MGERTKQKFPAAAVPNRTAESGLGQRYHCFKFHDKYYYLCVIIDLFSRKVISYRVSHKSSTQLLTKTFKQAYADRQPKAALMFHSDRGTQYMSYAFVHLLEDFGVEQSFSRTARPHDNAVSEAFFSISKRRAVPQALYVGSGSDEGESPVLSPSTMLNALTPLCNIKLRNRQSRITG